MGVGATGLVVLLLACGGSGEAGGGNGSGVEASEPAAPEVVPAPPFSARSLDGAEVALEGLSGEVVLLNVWATWCVPCRKEIPALQALHEEYAGQGLRVVGVTVDASAAEAEIRRYIDVMGMTYDIWWDPHQESIARFGANGVPLTLLVDREGMVRWEHLGPFEIGDPELAAAVEAALAAAQPRRPDSTSPPPEP